MLSTLALALVIEHRTLNHCRVATVLHKLIKIVLFVKKYFILSKIYDLEKMIISDFAIIIFFRFAAGPRYKKNWTGRKPETGILLRMAL